MTTPFAHNLKLVTELFYYDGIILAHYSGDDRHYIIAWMDVVDDVHHWSVTETTIPDLQEYLDNKIPLLEIMRRSCAIHQCVGEFITEEGHASGTLVAFKDFATDCLPTEDSFRLPKD